MKGRTGSKQRAKAFSDLPSKTANSGLNQAISAKLYIGGNGLILYKQLQLEIAAAIAGNFKPSGFKYSVYHIGTNI